MGNIDKQKLINSIISSSGGKLDKASAVLGKIYATDAEVKEEIDITTTSLKGETKGKWSDLLKPGILLAVIAGSAIAILGQFMGVILRGVVRCPVGRENTIGDASHLFPSDDVELIVQGFIHGSLYQRRQIFLRVAVIEQFIGIITEVHIPKIGYPILPYEE